MARAKQVKSLSKLQSRITKKKGAAGSKTLHENSRDARALDRAALRHEKIGRQQNVRSLATQPYLERIAVFQDTLRNSEKEMFDDEDMKDTIIAYLRRDEDELAELQATRRPGRPTSTREDAIKARRDQEEKEFLSGFWCPDCRNGETVAFLKAWRGTWNELAVFKFVRVNKEGVVKESKFPPKGES